MADEVTVTSRAKTTDNAANLAPSFLSSVLKRYGGTALGRQEIDGEIVEDQAADFGMPPVAFTVRICQLSESHGRGNAVTAVL